MSSRKNIFLIFRSTDKKVPFKENSSFRSAAEGPRLRNPGNFAAAAKPQHVYNLDSVVGAIRRRNGMTDQGANKVHSCQLSLIFLFLAVILFPVCFGAHAACEPGCREVSNACEPCPTGTFNADGGVCAACPAGETGNVITGATSCVAKKTLVSGNGHSAILRAVQTTHPSLAVQINGDPNTYYANLVAGLTGAFRLNYGGADYSTVDVGKDPATCKTPDLGGFRMTLNIPWSQWGYYEFFFSLYPKGNFTVDWGDGSPIENITKPNTAGVNNYHEYAGPGIYTVIINGSATGYDIGGNTINMEFNSPYITTIEGDLGKIFPVLSNPPVGTGGTPNFSNLFLDQTNLTSIPGNLFASVKGAPVEYMFFYAFAHTGITSIPDGLFSGIVGPPTESLFEATFLGCTNLTSIPDGLFDGISGAPAQGMFSATFYNCTNMTGQSATTKGSNGIRKPLYQEWPAATSAQVGGCYRGATKLSDWNTINTSFPNWR